MTDLIKNLFPPWALIIIILGALFLILTRKAWNKAVNDAAIKIRLKYFNLDRKGEEKQKNITEIKPKEIKELKQLYKSLGIKKIGDIHALIETNKKTIEESTTQQSTLFNLWKFYMFSYFNLVLVARSKVALVWLNNNPYSTKEMFCLNMVFPQNFDNKELEMEAVFNTLINYNLIDKDARDLYSISNIGSDFLKFTGLIS